MYDICFIGSGVATTFSLIHLAKNKYKGKILTVGSVEPWGTSYDIYFNFDKTLIPSDELVNLLTKNILSTNLDNNSKVTLVYFCDKLPAFNRYEKVPDDFTITRQTYDLK